MLRTLAATSILLLAAGFMAGAKADDVTTLRTLNVTGHGEVRQRPDIAMVSAGVASQAATADAALAANTTAMKSVVAALREAGIADKDIQTDNFSVQPQYDYGDNQAPKLRGYEVQNTVSFTLRDLLTLGAILDKLVRAGANQISGISFDIADPAGALDEARKRAVADAKHKAQIYASAGGIVLGPIVSLSEEAGAPSPVPVRAAMEKASPAGPVPVAEGQNVVAVDVSVAWSLK
jgi:uncharacterized protein YggE